MDCNVILDLMPLEIDGCCSKESAEMVKNHIQGCSECRSVYEDMKKSVLFVSEPKKDKKVKKIQTFKASVLQSLSVYLSFMMIVAGVWMEASTPMGAENGKWALLLILPSTAFFFALSNLYIMRSYKSERSFRSSSVIMCAFFSAFGYIWAFMHYGAEVYFHHPAFAAIGIVLSLALSALSGLIACLYARLTGKE